jgi:hypothetical protein
VNKNILFHNGQKVGGGEVRVSLKLIRFSVLPAIKIVIDFMCHGINHLYENSQSSGLKNQHST